MFERGRCSSCGSAEMGMWFCVAMIPVFKLGSYLVLADGRDSCAGRKLVGSIIGPKWLDRLSSVLDGRVSGKHSLGTLIVLAYALLGVTGLILAVLHGFGLVRVF